MKRKSRTLLRPYQVALRQYLAHGVASGLRAAERLGRQAVSLGLETLDLALIHEQALLAQILPAGISAARDVIIKRAMLFFAEAIIPLEATHRSALESNVQLSRLNRALKRRTMDLTASTLKLQQEITRRHAVEENLRQSEQHASRLLEKSRVLQGQLRLLSREVLTAQEEERKRISRELHDVIAQTLTGINVRLANLKIETQADNTGLSRKISHTQRLVEKSVCIVHQFARKLRPAMLDDLGLISALHTFMKEYRKETGIRVSLTAFAGVERVSGARRTALYRVAQQALGNVARHAHASQVDVCIREMPNAVRMEIHDNGKSFDVNRVWHAKSRKRLGLFGMRERLAMVGGCFSVESAPGKGTTIAAQVPFRNRTKEETRL